MGNEGSSQSSSGSEISNTINVSWTKSKSEFPARDGHCACSVGSKMYIFGGVSVTPDGGFSESNEMLLFNTEHMKLERVQQKGELPAARSAATLTAVGNKLFLFGGISQETGWFSLDDIHVYNTDTCVWSFINCKGSPPSPRDKHATCAIGNKLYLFGGFGPQLEEEVEEVEEFSEDEEELHGLEAQQEAAQFGWFNDLFIYDTETNTWSNPLQMNLGVPTQRAAFGMCAVDKHLVIFGGKDAQARRNDVHIFDTETRRWLTDMKSSGRVPEPRSFHTATTVQNRVVVMGGRGVRDQHFNDIHIFDTKTREWLQPKVEGERPPGCGVHATVVVGDSLVMYGGSADFNREIMQCTKYFGDIYSTNIDNVLSGTSTPRTEPAHGVKRTLEESAASAESPPAEGSSGSPPKKPKEDLSQ